MRRNIRSCFPQRIALVILPSPAGRPNFLSRGSMEILQKCSILTDALILNRSSCKYTPISADKGLYWNKETNSCTFAVISLIFSISKIITALLQDFGHLCLIRRSMSLIKPVAVPPALHASVDIPGHRYACTSASAPAPFCAPHPQASALRIFAAPLGSKKARTPGPRPSHLIKTFCSRSCEEDQSSCR